ncbi:FtsW/RodA/SpoVE family cell cycle protein [Saccharibacillus qingshengii]|uniref:FtsW/RodA/SpoVE family cell cycle protein n=1 Tax=Saccharibacillus qingshengii TaxID=1763540 RepID=UPI00155794A6|nr:FtsW/RodA/SpoVE family cell cycle protein [Saccharibacillus qingshengii]
MNDDQRKTGQPDATADRDAHVRGLERREAETSINAYLDRLCARIRAKELHPELRDEMRGHIEELIASKKDEGASPVEAAAWAMEQMGDADEIGGTLGQVHRPKFNWRLLVPLAVMAGIGLLALFSLAASGTSMFESFNPGKQQLFFYGMGVVVLIACCLFDYRLLNKYAVSLYTGTALLMIFLFTFASVTVNGNSGWISVGPLTFNGTLCMFVLFVLALPGVLDRLSLRHAPGRSIRHSIAIGVILLPTALYVYFDLLAWLALGLYLIAATLLYARAGGAKLYLYPLPAAAAAWAAGLYLRNPHWQDRFQAIFAPRLQSPDAHYMNDAMAVAIREGGWFGRGFGSSGRSIVYAHSDTIFPYLTYSFGWIMAGLLVASIVWLIVLLLHTVRKIGDPIGRSMAAGLSILLAGQWIYGIGASLSLLPFTSLLLPFIGYGGSSTIVHCAIVGLILGIYRRKDMLPAKRHIGSPKIAPSAAPHHG